jgi:hypothetical protein
MEDLVIENEYNSPDGIAGNGETMKWILEIERLLALVHEKEQVKLPNSIRKYLFGIRHFKDELHHILLEPIPNPDEISAAIREMGIRANKLLKNTNTDDSDLVPVDHIKQLHRAIKNYEHSFFTSASPSTLSPEEMVASRVDLSKLSAGLEILNTQLAAVQHESKRSRKYILESQKHAEEVSGRLAGFDERLVETLSASSSRVEAVLLDLEEKQREVNEMVGAVTASAMAGSYSNSADSERKLAEGMRNGSVFLMLTISCLVGYSLLETTQPHFDWQIALFRLLFSLALSVPAAYLARESTRHRDQQYAFLSVSLDLKSITPYLASLPPDDQNRLKVEIANRIFGQKSSRSAGDSYPLNIQELIVELLKKIEIPPTKKAVD